MGVERDNVVNFEVRVSIDNASGELRANMTSNAEIVLEEHKGTLIIPERAVIYDASARRSPTCAQPARKTGRERVPITRRHQQRHPHARCSRAWPTATGSCSQ